MNILAYPHFDNPYQDLLYKELNTEFNVNVIFFDEQFLNKHRFFGPLLFPFGLITYRLLGFKVFHLHWQNFIFYSNKNVGGKFLSFCYSVVFILFLKLFNFKVVWTIHNIIPHEKITSNDLLFSRILSRLVDRKIVHSEMIISELNNHNLNTDNVNVIPLGNYINYYKNTITVKDARNKLHIIRSEFVILFFGIVRKYKGIDDLIITFQRINKINKNITLIIAGKILDEEIINLLFKAKEKLGNKLIIKNQYIHDDQIQEYMKATDLVIFPFKKITSSSSMLLALSFAKPIIYPNISSLKEIPNEVGFKYEVESNSLYNAILLSFKNKKKLNQMGLKGISYAKRFSWQLIADKTFKLYQN